MDLTAVKAFLGEHLNTREAVEHAAGVAGVSTATMYRYKSNPEGISLGVLARLSKELGLPLTDGAAWTRSDILGSERRRLALENTTARLPNGKRLTTLPAYTVNDELPEVTRSLLKSDYGTQAPVLEVDVLEIRAHRAGLYQSGRYASWEIWSASGFGDFAAGKGRYSVLPEALRAAQIEVFKTTTLQPDKHRYFYDGSDLPMFGCYLPSGTALVRVDDIHLEFQDVSLVASFEETFNSLLERCFTKTNDEFLGYLSNFGRA